jgi:hypothetical protein
MGSWSQAKLTFTTWDFSGSGTPEIPPKLIPLDTYTALHHMFLYPESQTIYLLVWDMSQSDQITTIEYWLNTIQDESPVVRKGVRALINIVDSRRNAYGYV